VRKSSFQQTDKLVQDVWIAAPIYNCAPTNLY